MNVALGGGAGSGGDGGEVFAQIDSTVQTEGDSSNAVLVQSVGGGGGNGGFSVAGGINGSDGAAVGISVGLGGKGGTAGKGNQVIAVSSGDLSTKGSSSHGFVAQSMGGGGGTGGFNVSGTASGSGISSGGISVGLGGEGGEGNDGGCNCRE